MQVPSCDEQQVLKLKSRQLAIIRQVKLLCDDEALVYARTVIPVSTLCGKQRIYANLGNRPLGAMLFADSSMRREQIMVSKLSASDVLHQRTGVTNKEEVWGRRSVFYVSEKPLLVSEYFLPALFTAEK